MSKFTNEKHPWSNYKAISLMTAVLVLIIFSFYQIGWAAVILCPDNNLCNGTDGDDIIFGLFVHGLGGNDYIVGSWDDSNVLFGDDGNDILIGGISSDFMKGGKGSDKYDGYYGSDTIYEDTVYGQAIPGTLVNNDDIISGGEGDDFIFTGEGSDKIQAGPGNDFIYPDGYRKDFSFDTINCGSGTDKIDTLYRGDGDSSINCENILDFDR